MMRWNVLTFQAGSNFPTRPSVIERVLQRMSLRHPWAWRVRLDLMVVVNLLSMVAVLVLLVSLPSAESTSSAEAMSAFILSGGALLAAGAGFYWAFSVAKGLRLRDAAKYGASPGPVTSALFCLSIAFWLVAATLVPSCMMLRDPMTGLPVGDIIKIYEHSLPNVPYGTKRSANELAAIQREEASIRDNFEHAAPRPASLISSLWYRKEEWHWYQWWDYLDFNDPLHGCEYVCKSLYDYAQNQDPWRSRLASMKPWETRNMVLVDPVLRERFRNADALRTRVRDYVLGSRGMDGDKIQSLVGADYIARLAAEIDATMMNGMTSAPPLLHPEVWQRVEASLFEAFMDSNSDELFQNRRRLPESVRNEVVQKGRIAWEETKKNVSRLQLFKDSAAFRKWREDFALMIAGAGGLDDLILHRDPFAKIVEAWRAAVMEAGTLPERRLSYEVSSSSSALLIGLIALAFGLFTASVVRVGVSDTLASLALAVILSTLLLLGITIGLTAILIILPDFKDDKGILTFGLLCASTVALLLPVVRDFIKLRQGRWSRRLALASALLGAFWMALWAVASLSLDFLPNDAMKEAGGFLICVFIGLSYAAVVHALLARTDNFPRIT